MIVRIRLSHGPRVNPYAGEETPRPLVSEAVPLPDPGKVHPQEAAHAASLMLSPICWSAWALVLWKLGADMRITGPFFVSEGFFSHWQVWFALACTVQFAAANLRRRALPRMASSPAKE